MRLGPAQARGLERIGQRIQNRGPGVPLRAEGWQVALDDRDQDAYPSASSKRSGDRECERALTVQHQAHQGAPRQRDPQFVDATAEHRERRRSVADQKQRVRQATLARWPGGSARSITHAARIGVHANREDARIVPGSTDDGRAIARAQIDDRSPIAGDQLM
jgi:hypothetical protein